MKGGLRPHPILYYVLFSARFGNEPGFFDERDGTRNVVVGLPTARYDFGDVAAPSARTVGSLEKIGATE